jgi:hypothetical protein
MGVDLDANDAVPPRMRWSLHALHEASRRGLAVKEVEQTALQPDQVVPVRSGREVRQSLDDCGRLVRVIIDLEGVVPVIVTAYRTTKVHRYWQRES